MPGTGRALVDEGRDVPWQGPTNSAMSTLTSSAMTTLTSSAILITTLTSSAMSTCNKCSWQTCQVLFRHPLALAGEERHTIDINKTNLQLKIFITTALAFSEFKRFSITNHQNSTVKNMNLFRAIYQSAQFINLPAQSRN